MLKWLAALCLACGLASSPAAAKSSRDAFPPGVHDVFDPAKAAQSCQAGNMNVCAWLGIATWSGIGIPADKVKGDALLDRACTAKIDVACLAKADGLFEFADVCGASEYCTAQELSMNRDTRMRALGHTINVAACLDEVTRGAACFNAGQLVRIGFDLRKDEKAARGLYGLGCEQGHGNSCRMLAEMAAGGLGGPADGSLAFLSAGAACELKAKDACAYALYLHQEGKAGDVKEADLADVTQRGCDAGTAVLCMAAAAYAEKSLPDAAAAARLGEFLQRACDAKTPKACLALGSRLYNGTNMPKDAAAARTAFVKACDQRAASGCYNAGALTADKTEAKTLFERALAIDPAHEGAKKGLATVI